jgi:hypothetical protein
LVFVKRRERNDRGPHNRALRRTLLIAVTVLALVMAVPAVRTLFAFGIPPPLSLLLAVASGPALLMVVRLAQAVGARR